MNKNLVIGFLVLVIVGMGFMLMKNNVLFQGASVLKTQDAYLALSEESIKEINEIRDYAKNNDIQFNEPSEKEFVVIQNAIDIMVSNMKLITPSTGNRMYACFFNGHYLGNFDLPNGGSSTGWPSGNPNVYCWALFLN